MGIINKIRDRLAKGDGVIASFAARDQEWEPPKPETSVYVVGDIHGMIQSFERLLEQIDGDIGSNQVANPKLVFVGDYIDRGDFSSDVLLRVAELAYQMPDNVVCLMGNHEKMMLDFLDRPREKGRRWIRNGGLQTVASFGVRGVVTENAEDDVLADLSATFREALPDGLEDWIRSMPMWWQSGNLAVVHASANPVKPMSAQSERSLLWGNEAFFEVERDDALWVAHGHTVFETALAAKGRIAVDTGAVFGGKLTAGVIRPTGEVSFLSA